MKEYNFMETEKKISSKKTIFKIICFYLKVPKVIGILILINIRIIQEVVTGPKSFK